MVAKRVFSTIICDIFRAIIGEIDETMDSSIDLGAIRAEPIGSVVFWDNQTHMQFHTTMNNNINYFILRHCYYYNYDSNI